MMKKKKRVEEEIECCVMPAEVRRIDVWGLERIVQEAMSIGCQQASLVQRTWDNLPALEPEIIEEEEVLGVSD